MRLFSSSKHFSHDNCILDHFFTSRPDVCDICFTVQSTVKTWHVKALVYNGCERLSKNG